ncbi:heterokaryon incompatibility protein-domain-containing protein [Hyaloscypha sp. PMI_1271]|nr:heterokaryon incompatibility protein-domain-containing protein [Hyaloscypha sp. PMI_1271]
MAERIGAERSPTAHNRSLTFEIHPPGKPSSTQPTKYQIHYHYLRTTSARFMNDLFCHTITAPLEMSQYQYSPLRKDRDELRLIRLLPGPISAEVEIEIFHAQRSSKYEALSYVWGPPERTDVALVRKPVKALSKLVRYVNRSKRREHSEPSATIGITDNLAVALRHLRDPNKSRILWVDAICINQDDLAERSAEVLEMGSIYSRAEQVVVWLGPSSKDSRLAVETLKKLGDGIRYHVDDHTISHKTAQLEIGLATKATLFVGQDGIDWFLFTTAIRWLWKFLERLNEVFHDLKFEDLSGSGVSGLITTSSSKYPRELGLPELLIFTSRLDSSDPRDRLYAIRALVAPSGRKFITPDYSKSVEEAFRNFTLRFCQETGDGFLLTRCSLRDASSKLQMPSWVPDFSATDLPNMFHDFGRDSRISAVLNNESLTVQGVKLATITSLLGPFETSYANFEIIQVLRSWQVSCGSGMYPSGGLTSDAFIDAIVCGQLAGLMPTERSCLSLEECRRILNPGEAGVEVEVEDIKNNIKASFVGVVRANLLGRVFFKTREGFFGICPESAKYGDVVVVFPGVKAPLVLRPVTHQGHLSYRIVGASYVHGAMHAEVLLGSIPVGWTFSYKTVNRDARPVFADGNILTQKDPRLPLPPEWRYKYLLGERVQDAELDSSMNYLPQVFENVKTKELSWYDPMVTPDALRERGIDVQGFVLV